MQNKRRKMDGKGGAASSHEEEAGRSPEANLPATVPQPENAENQFFTRDSGYLRCRQEGITYEIEISSIEAVKQGIRATVRILSGTARIVHSDSIGLWSAQRRTQFAESCTEFRQWNSIPSHLIEIHEKLKGWVEQQSKEASTMKKQPVMTPEEKKEALELLRAPDILDRIKTDIDRLGHVGEDLNKLIVYMVATSRKLGHTMRSICRPLILLVQGESSVGKSYLLKNILKLMPAEEVVELSSLSEKALLYLPRDFLRHKLLTIAEMPGGEAANYYIRTLISEGLIRHAVTVKDEKTGQFQTRIVEMDGPIALAQTTTAVKINEENRTRLIEIRPDDSPEQTERIQEQQKWERTKEGRAAQASIKSIILQHQNAQRLLRPMDVVIPFVDKLRFSSTQHSLRLRRDFPKFLDLVSSAALLRQHQKKIMTNGNGLEYLEADIYDYWAAYKLAEEAFQQSFDTVPPKSRELLKIISENAVDDATFTRKDVRKWSGWRETTVRKYIKPLQEEGYLAIDSGGSGGKPFEYSPDIDTTPPAQIGLISPSELQEELRKDEE